MHCRSLVAGVVVLSSLVCLRLSPAADGSLASKRTPAEMTEGTSSGGSVWSILRHSKSLTTAGRWAKSYARSLVIDRFGRPEWRTHFGLELDADWQKAPLDKGLVVFVHGYQSRPE